LKIFTRESLRRNVYFMLTAFLLVPPLYNYLAAGGLPGLIINYLVFWPVAFMLIIAYQFRNVHCDDDKKRRWGGWFFWILVSYFCLPITLNLISVLLRYQSNSWFADLVFRNRYTSIPLVIALILSWGVIVGISTDIKEKLGSLFSSGSQGPPAPPDNKGRKKAFSHPGDNDQVIECSLAQA